MYNIIQLNDKDLSELQSIAKELGIKKTDSLKKEDLVYKILDEQAIVGATQKVAAEKANESQPRKRSRINVKKDGDKVYTVPLVLAVGGVLEVTAQRVVRYCVKEVLKVVERDAGGLGNHAFRIVFLGVCRGCAGQGQQRCGKSLGEFH